MLELNAMPREHETPLAQKWDGAALEMVARLCSELSAAGIEYCHWKSNPFLGRSASGDNDLDLLVSREHADEFCSILNSLGFKETVGPDFDELPGVQNYYGYDRETGKLVHVHAHFQLILGHDLTKNYRLPVEEPYLAASHPGPLFRVPAPEVELVVFVMRMVLKHSTWDTMLIGHGKLSPSEQAELKCLAVPEVLAKVPAALQDLGLLDAGLFNACLRAVQPGGSLSNKIHAGEQLQKALRTYGRRSQPVDIVLKLWRRVWRPVLSRVFRYAPKKRFAHGGFFVAIVGGDGSGKTTLLDELTAWLADTFEITRLHMGKPRWSLLTTLLRGMLKIGTALRLYRFEGDVYEEAAGPHGFPWFVRAVCTARDRYLTFTRARRDAANGRVVLSDRYSLPGFLATDGPQCGRALAALEKPSHLLQSLAGIEASYYRCIQLPDQIIVLKVDPEIAVQRKSEETEASVRARSGEVFEKDWNGLPAHVLDASLPKAEILAQARALLWEAL
jgi:thymidylate kinase